MEAMNVTVKISMATVPSPSQCYPEFLNKVS